MMHARKKLIVEILKHAKSLDEKGYSKTASEIVSLTKSLERSEKDASYQERAFSLLEIFKEEFVETLFDGQDYRRRCFEEIHMMILQAIASLGDEFRQSASEILHFVQRMKEIDTSLIPMSELFASLASNPNRSARDNALMFSSASYIYLISLEGVFDDLARILYFFIIASKKHVLRSEDLDGMEVWDILRACKQIYGVTPVFLENWEEKRHLRNAIGHARAQYCSTRNEVHFEDLDIRTKSAYHKTMSVYEFYNINMEIIDTIDSFRYTIELIYILELLIAAFTHRNSANLARAFKTNKRKLRAKVA